MEAQISKWERFKRWFMARWKAFYAFILPIVIGYLATALTDPSTADQVQSFLPPEFKWLVPPIIGIITGIVVERKKNAPLTE